MSNAGGNILVPDFRADIRSAIEHAEPAGADGPLQGKNDTAAAQHSQLADYPDNYVIPSFFIPGHDEVGTTNPAHYKHLLLQAVEIINDGELPDDLDEVYSLDEVVKHELAHGSASKLGNARLRNHFCAAFYLDEEGEPAFWPFQTVSGSLKKVHLAWSAAAPEDRSDTDKQLVAMLGYDPEDVAGLYERAQAEPPFKPTEKLDDALQASLAARLLELFDTDQ